MIRELLQTVGNPDVFFDQQRLHNHPFYNPIVISGDCWDELRSYSGYWNAPVFAEMSFGQTRDYINAVADELGEPSNMPYDRTTDTFYSSTYSPESEKRIVNAASSLRDAQTKINTWFSRPSIAQEAIDTIVQDCFGITSRYWQTDDPMESRIRKDIIKKHISLRLKMWIDGKTW